MDRYLANKKIKLFSKEEIEPHETLLDKLAKQKEEELGISEKKFETLLLGKILLSFFYFSVFLIFVLFLRTFQLQIIEGKNFISQANANKYIFHNIQAERGVIYDKNLKQLVFNTSQFNLILRKENLPETDSEKERVFKEVAQILNQPYLELEKKIKENNDSVMEIASNLGYETLVVLETKIEQLPGFEIQENSVRDYPDGEIFSHLIGYMGKIQKEELKEEPDFYSLLDYIGREGIEKSYEKVLRRNPGKIQIERDVKGNIISKEISSLPKSGKSLVLWLDSDLQKKLKEELEKELQIIGAKKAIAIAMDPKTGGVLSLISLPSFDNNIFVQGNQEAIGKILLDKNEPLFNRVIAGRYPSGSTIKPLISLAALEEKIITPEKEINCQGKITIQDFWHPEKIWEYKDWAIHGFTNLRKAIAQSCNVYFYTIGGGYQNQEGLGPTRIKNYLDLFGWESKTQIDLPGEVTGFVPDKEWKKQNIGQGWWDGDTYNLAIGQGYLKVTPLEVITSFLPIANGGRMLQPQIVKAIVDEEKNVIEEKQPIVIKENFINTKNIQIVREGMREGVTYGSSVLLNDLPVKAASKTGTAQTSRVDYYHNWVTVFAPYEDPQIVLTIMIEEVPGVQAAVLPVAKNVLSWYFNR